MRCPTLKELPLPSSDKSGWPWTEESPQISYEMPGAESCPKITIVTPSYNQGCFIEETIRSVLLQGYPNLEYMIFDGGSNDCSTEIIKKYSPWLTYWISEPDGGQAHAINKGFSRSTGSLLAWINSDDYYLTSALKSFAEYHLLKPQSILLGDVENFVEGENRSWLVKQDNVSFFNIVRPENDPWSWHQPGLFIPGSLTSAVGLLDENLRYAFDIDWLLRLLKSAVDVSYLNRPVARFRVHQAAKTTAEYPECVNEGHRLLQRKYWPMVPGLDVSFGKALHSLRMAQIYLGYQPNHAIHWNRAAGLFNLMIACWQNPRIVLRSDFLKLFRRVILPKRLFRSSPWQGLKGVENNHDNQVRGLTR